MAIVWELLETTDPVSWELDPNADPAAEDMPGRRAWLPLPALADAGKVPKVKPDGTGYVLGTVSGGGGLSGWAAVLPVDGEADVAAAVDGTTDTASTVVVVTTTDDPLTVLLPDETAVGSFTLIFARQGFYDLSSISYELNGSPYTPLVYGGEARADGEAGILFAFHAIPSPDLGNGAGWTLLNAVTAVEWDDVAGKPAWIDGFTRPQVIFSRLHIGDGVTEDIDPTTGRLDFPVSGTYSGHPSFEIDGLSYQGGQILIMGQPDNADSGVWEPTWDAGLESPTDTPGVPTGWWKGVRPTTINGWVTADLIAEGMTFWIGSGTRYNNTHWTPQWSSNMAPVSGGSIKPVHVTIDHLRDGGTVTDGHVLVADSASPRGFTFEAQSGGGVSLGETSTTAYRGDRGKTAYDHSQLTTGNPHSVTKSDVGLGNVTNDAQLKVASNLSDLNSAATARTNLGLGGAATLAVGTTAGTVAAGNHTHTGLIVGGQDEGASTSNLNTEVSLLDSTITVTATAGELLRIDAFGTYLNDSGSGRSPTVRLKLGSTTVLSWNAAVTNNAATRNWVLSAVIRVEANNDYNASGTLLVHTTTFPPAQSVGTDAIQSGLALDLTWQQGSTNATQTAQLSGISISRVRSTIS